MQWHITDSGSDGGDPARVNPYAEWEPLQRRPALAALPGPRYQPVYVTLNSHATTTAAALLNRAPVAGWQDYLLDSVGVECLNRLANGGDTSRHGALFLYIAEDADIPASSPEITVRFVAPALALPIRVGADVATASADLSIPAVPNTADGSPPVFTAVIDDFIAFANDRFLGPSGTRVQAIWGQDHPDTAPNRTLQFGTAFSKTDIDALRASATSGSTSDEDRLYRKAFQGPALRGFGPAAKAMASAAVREALYQRPFGYPDAHGTHVLDLAAGAPPGSDDAPILAVQLPQLATAETWGARLDHFILLALHQILLWADTAAEAPAPCVINISYAVQAGAKDGTGFLGTEMARLVAARNANVTTRLVLAAGNSYRARCHAQGTVSPDAPATFAWRLPPDDQSDNFLEILSGGAADTTLRLSLPQGAPSVEVTLKPGTRAELRQDGLPLARVTVLAHPSGVRTVLSLAPTQNRDQPARRLPAGDLHLTLATPVGGAPFSYSADVQRDDTPTSFPRRGRQSWLETPGSYAVDPVTLVRDRPEATDPMSRAGTLSPYATVENTAVIVVGAALAQNLRTKAALYASAGPTPGRAMPTCAAAGDETWSYRGRLGAGTFSGGTARLAGSSAAAPLVARALAAAIADGTIGRDTSPDAAISALGWPTNHPDDQPQLGAATQPVTAAPGRLNRRECPA